MYPEILASIFSKRDKIVELSTSNFDRFQQFKDQSDVRFDTTQPIPGIVLSLSEINIRLIGLADLIRTLDNINEIPLIPTSYPSVLNSTLDALIAQLVVWKNNLDKVDKGGGPASIDLENFIINIQDGGSSDFKSPLIKVHRALDNSLVSYYPLAILINGDGYKEFSSSFAQFAKGLETVRNGISEVGDLKQKAEKEEKNIEAHQTEASNLKSLIDNLKGESEKSRKNIADYESEVTTKVAKINEVHTDAESLKSTVKSYQAQFKSFQDQLDKREKTFTDGKVNLDNLISKGKEEQDRLIIKLKEIEDEIERLTQQAKDMLGGATIAGLAGSFGVIRDKLTIELDSARRTFYWAIIILFFSAIPLMMYVIPGFDFLSSTQEKGGIGEIIVRALFLLPGAWFTKFAAARHASLFRLKEHYTYKYSVASSVEGFKKQAEPFKDGIAAAAFFELTFNPANYMEIKGQEQRHPNKAMEWIMNKLGATYDGNSS